MNLHKLDRSIFDELTTRYTSLVQEQNLLTALEQDKHDTIAFFRELSCEKLHYRYAPDKWTIQEVLQHLIDTERIFAYRALCIARGKTEPLAGFDVDSYAINSLAPLRTFESLLMEFVVVRSSSQLLFKSFTDDMLQRVGVASGARIQVAALGFRMAGHTVHHCKMIKERYLK